MKAFKIGSLFDGSGGFPLAASLCRGTPTWASEVEPYPIAVTRSRFPTMRHLGDVSKVNGAEVNLKGYYTGLTDENAKAMVIAIYNYVKAAAEYKA